MKEIKDFKYIAFGITNQCTDAYEIPFFDYDIDDLPMIIIELLDMQFKFRLSTIYLIKSTTGYNAFSLDKLPFNTLELIYETSKLIDRKFVKWGLHRGFMTLRMGKDKRFIKSLNSRHTDYIKSSAHKVFFTDIMDFPINDNDNFDNENKIVLTMFPSNKHGFKKELMAW